MPISLAYAGPREIDQQLLVGHLMFTAPPKHRAANAGSTAVSLVFHGAVLAAAIYVTSLPATRTAVTEAVHLIQLADDRANEPAPPPPPPPAQAVQREAVHAVAAVPRGFQTLQAPTITPPDIPPPTAGPVVNEADYSGVGTEGGRAYGRVSNEVKAVTAEDVEAAPVFTPYTVGPVLKNPVEVQKALERLYPAVLRDAGVTGTTLLWILIDERGGVTKTVVKQSSGTELLDDAASRVAKVMRFSAGISGDIRVKVWVAIPISFKTSEP